MEAFLGTENIVAGKGGNNTMMMTMMETMAAERIPVKRPSLGSAMRKKLSDITNVQQRSLLASPSKDENTKPIPTAAYYIDQLQKENATLLRLVAEKNKIIELSGLELEKLQLNVKKVHLQNFQLAQANSHMLAELNFGKDRLKALQHALGCTMAALKAKNLELEGKLKTSHQISTEEKPATDNKPCNPPNRRRQSRMPSSNKSAVTQQNLAKEKDDNNKRICLRRRSSTFKFVQPEPTEDLFEIEDAQFPVHPPLLDDSMLDDSCRVSLDSSSACVSNANVKLGKEEKEGESTLQLQGVRRSSIGRPLRKAAEKVNTYKEKPLNFKLRRTE